MANTIIINNKNSQTTRSRRGGSKTGGKKLMPCRACKGTGWEDIINKCTTCHGTGYVRV
ncbi:MAG: hypothetical protein WCE94_10870 [Candidatus Methanoperedens sp.]